MTDHSALEPIDTPDKLTDNEIQIVRLDAKDMPEAYIQQIVDKSRQEHVMKFEGHEDVGTEAEPGRFYNVEAYIKWATKGRTVYLMTKPREDSDELDVGGIIWFGERKNEYAPEHDTTFAIRNYDEDEEKGWSKFVGMGYGTPFMQATHEDMAKTAPDKKIWLDVTEGNDAGYHLYQKVGYEETNRTPDPEHEDRCRITMVYAGKEKEK